MRDRPRLVVDTLALPLALRPAGELDAGIRLDQKLHAVALKEVDDRLHPRSNCPRDVVHEPLVAGRLLDVPVEEVLAGSGQELVGVAHRSAELDPLELQGLLLIKDRVGELVDAVAQTPPVVFDEEEEVLEAPLPLLREQHRRPLRTHRLLLRRLQGQLLRGLRGQLGRRLRHWQGRVRGELLGNSLLRGGQLQLLRRLGQLRDLLRRYL
mmetsp:Transcript_52914/g.106164  ORF Transcript_52914/g.106164 Transcript_52914/m.106164 type:complete len:210 (-) Transcript_52914:525-1154(-)